MAGFPQRYKWLLLPALALVLAYILYRPLNEDPFLKRQKLKHIISQSASDIKSPFCTSIAKTVPGLVVFNPDAEFLDIASNYWSEQAVDAIPSCIIRPRDTREVSASIKAIRREHDLLNSTSTAPFSFAVRSGGHFPEPGFSSAAGGVVLDVSLLNQVRVLNGSQTAVLGTGARWGEVYEQLEKEGVAVAGGRAADVGVGGLTLGGGISFHSQRLGFVCDNIIEYEVVLADGTITRASATENRSLWRALKGGGGTFGVVTYFTAQTFPASMMWGGCGISRISKAPQYIQALYDFTVQESYDQQAAGPIIIFTFLREWHLSMVTPYVMYAEPTEWPAVYSQFERIGRLWSDIKVRPLSDASSLIKEGAPSGRRQHQATTVVRADHATLARAYELWREAREASWSIRGFTFSMAFQPITLNMIRHGDANVLGLNSRSEPLVNILLTNQWHYAKDDVEAIAIGRTLIQDINDYAESVGTIDSYKYLNYADGIEDVFASYGEENLRLLKDVSRQYDHEGFFLKARAAGFKLDV